MRTLLSVVCALVAVPALAQEIGKEIPAETKKNEAQFEDPFARTAPTTPATAPAAPGRVAGPRKGAFGLRGSFTGSAFPQLQASSTATIQLAPSAVPTFGLRYQLSDSLGLAADVGLAVGIASRFQFGFGVGAALEIYLGSAKRPVRGLLVLGTGVAKPLTRESDDLLLRIDAGFGAEYWFADEFSVQARALIGVPIDIQDTENIPIATVTPGLAATFHF